MMNDKKSPVQKFLEGKGFYIALALCVAGTGTAAWLAVNRTIDDIDDQNQKILESRPQTEDFTDPGEVDAEQNGVTISSDVSSSQEPAAQPSGGSASSVPQNTSALQFSLPVAGEKLNPYSDGKLVKDATLGDYLAGKELTLTLDGVTKKIELPEYKNPSARTVAIYVWEKVKDYLTKAGTTIFVASILMWLILNFGPGGYTTEMSQSFGALLGKWLVPFFAPIGLGFWQIAVALIAGISAKEVVVSSTAVLFGINNINSTQGMHALSGVLQGMGFGALNAYCLMIFCLLYIPCIATLATIHKESRSWKWTGLTILFQMATAWVLTFVVYQVGLLI